MLRDYEILEFWWGFCFNIFDEMLILGKSNYDNLILVIGYYWNGILLVFVIGMLIVDLIWNN